jgi:hypothetical protein
MSRADGAVLGTTRLVDNGRPQRRWNVTILGDGFTTAEMPAYEAAALNAANTLFSLEPFSLIRRSINVFRVNVRSDVSGVTVNPGCGGTATRRQTFFNGSFCHSGLPRLTAVDNGLAWDIAREQVPQTHVVLVILNSTMFGGAGGSVATCSLASGAAALALHELCHSAFGLADEYESWRGCGVDTDRNVHGFTALNLVEPNVTVHEDLEDLIQHKW